MEQALIEQVKQLLQSTGSIIAKHEKIARLKGENFNVFRVLEIEYKEDELHSRFIAELLDPKGSHDQQTTFLKMFLEQVVDPLIPDSLPNECKLRPDESKAKVHREYYIGPKHINGEKSTGGRIDIFITDGIRHISIENKIREDEGEHQVTRYCNYKSDSNLVLFFTLRGDEASTEKKYHPISYREHILQWLKSCQKHCADLPILRATIKQYIITIKGLTGDLTMQKKDEKVKQLMRGKIEAAHAIYSNYEPLFKETVKKFVQEVKKEIEGEKPVSCSSNDWEITPNDGNGLRIRNTQWNENHHLQIDWAWAKKRAKSAPFYGIIVQEDHFNRDKIKEKLDGIERLGLDLYDPKYPEWPFYTYTKEADFQDPNQLKTLWKKEERKELVKDVARKLIELIEFCDSKLLP